MKWFLLHPLNPPFLFTFRQTMCTYDTLPYGLWLFQFSTHFAWCLWTQTTCIFCSLFSPGMKNCPLSTEKLKLPVAKTVNMWASEMFWDENSMCLFHPVCILNSVFLNLFFFAPCFSLHWESSIIHEGSQHLQRVRYPQASRYTVHNTSHSEPRLCRLCIPTQTH